MNEPFDSDAIAKLGWRQGAILDATLANIRAAFPTAFDLRWRSKLKDWQKLLRKQSEWLQGVYVRLSTLAELPETQPYKCHVLLAVPHEKRRDSDWPLKREELERAEQH